MNKLITFAFALSLGATAAARPPTDSTLGRDRREHVEEIQSIKSKMVLYALDHKMATAALIGAGGGLASVLTENMDPDTRNFLMGLGMLGSLYCLSDSDAIKECAVVAFQLGSYMAKVDVHQKAIARIDRDF